MQRRLTKRKSLTPDEKRRLAKRALYRFRAVVRKVISNLYWLDEASEGELGTNVLQNIHILTRRKDKYTSPLLIKDKALLNIPPENRTVEDKMKINRTIGGLKCFRRYPQEVKADLAAVTRFQYIPPNRIVVKQYQPADALYFLLSGEVNVSQIAFDNLLNEMVTRNLGVMGPGTMFGEVALLLDINRTATVTTATHCELLKIDKLDFAEVLKATIWKTWEEILQSMNRFEYFRNWDTLSRRECCIMSRKASFNPGDIVFGGGIGFLNYVYFVTKGTCYIVEHLSLEPYNDKGVKKYRIYNPSSHPLVTDTDDNESERRRSSQDTRYIDDYKRRRSTIYTESGQIIEDSQSISSHVSALAIRSGSLTLTNLRSFEVQRVNVPRDVETFFIRVCDFSELACFNIGEEFKRRYVVADTHIECMLIPYYWLTLKSKGNIWDRIRNFLNMYIPKSEDILKDFLNQKKWKKYKIELVKDILANKKCKTTNTIHNVPYSIRIQEGSFKCEKPKKIDFSKLFS